jgi:hypothetical protein
MKIYRTGFVARRQEGPNLRLNFELRPALPGTPSAELHITLSNLSIEPAHDIIANVFVETSIQLLQWGDARVDQVGHRFPTGQRHTFHRLQNIGAMSRCRFGKTKIFFLPVVQSTLDFLIRIRSLGSFSFWGGNWHPQRCQTKKNSTE